MDKYFIEIRRIDKTICEGVLCFYIDNRKVFETKCWEDSENLIAAKKYTNCSSTIMKEKKYKSVYIPDNQTEKEGIFIHKGLSPEWSDGCIVCKEEAIEIIFKSVPIDSKNISIKIIE